MTRLTFNIQVIIPVHAKAPVLSSWIATGSFIALYSCICNISFEDDRIWSYLHFFLLIISLKMSRTTLKRCAYGTNWLQKKSGDCYKQLSTLANKYSFTLVPEFINTMCYHAYLSSYVLWYRCRLWTLLVAVVLPSKSWRTRWRALLPLSRFFSVSCQSPCSRSL